MFLALYLEQHESYKNGFHIAGKRECSFLFVFCLFEGLCAINDCQDIHKAVVDIEF